MSLEILLFIGSDICHGIVGYPVDPGTAVLIDPVGAAGTHIHVEDKQIRIHRIEHQVSGGNSLAFQKDSGFAIKGMQHDLEGQTAHLFPIHHIHGVDHILLIRRDGQRFDKIVLRHTFHYDLFFEGVDMNGADLSFHNVVSPSAFRRKHGTDWNALAIAEPSHLIDAADAVHRVDQSCNVTGEKICLTQKTFALSCRDKNNLFSGFRERLIGMVGRNRIHNSCCCDLSHIAQGNRIFVHPGFVPNCSFHIGTLLLFFTSRGYRSLSASSVLR